MSGPGHSGAANTSKDFLEELLDEEDDYLKDEADKNMSQTGDASFKEVLLDDEDDYLSDEAFEYEADKEMPLDLRAGDASFLDVLLDEEDEDLKDEANKEMPSCHLGVGNMSYWDDDDDMEYEDDDEYDIVNIPVLYEEQEVLRSFVHPFSDICSFLPPRPPEENKDQSNSDVSPPPTQRPRRMSGEQERNDDLSSSPTRRPQPMSEHESGPSLKRILVDFGDSKKPYTVIRKLPYQPMRGWGRGRRGGGRGVRTLRAMGRGGMRTAMRSAISWEPGKDLVEIYMNDSDVPPQLTSMIQAILDGRTARQKHQEDDDDEFYDAEEGTIAAELFNGDRSAEIFEWQPMSTFTGSQEPFLVTKTGPNGYFPTPYDAFRNYWDDELLQHIVNETNRYAAEISAQSEPFAKDWVDTNTHEMLIFFAFWMMLGVIRMPSINSCFSSSYLLMTTIFKKLLTKHRYWALNRAFHLYDKSKPATGKLHCLGPVLDVLNQKFMSSYTPKQDIAIDESLTLWGGNLSFKQYIKTKSARTGIKTYELCESSSGYLWSLFIYIGKDSSCSSLPKTIQFVKKLIGPLLNKGYRLFMDNWFNSPILARYLKRNKTDCVGTLNSHRKHVPLLVQRATIPRGRYIARHSGDVVVMAYQDKNTVRTISTCHGTETVFVDNKPTRPGFYRPKVINDYNKFMGGIDKKDQMLEPYLIERKRGQKWYKKMFKRLLNTTILNSRVLVMSSTGSAAQQLTFRLTLVDQIIRAHLEHVPTARVRSLGPSRLRQPQPNSRHFLVHIHPMNDEGKRVGPPKVCSWCRPASSINGTRPRRTRQMCGTCNVPLCKVPCFKEFHTKKKLIH